jgi:hypothetical protein
MSRPLVISDCDEVLLHMVAPFQAWLKAHHDIDFVMESNDFGKAMRYVHDGRAVESREIWRLLDLFFDTQMHTQPAIAGAVDAVGALADRADFVILTNLGTAIARRAPRNSKAWASRRGSLPTRGRKARRSKPFSKNTPHPRGVHRRSAPASPFRRATDARGDPPALVRRALLAPHIDCAHKAGHAHARIDTWDHALPWLLARLDEAA